jgi:4-hydroxy-3-methylbut-2-enyl diphosphate reductase
VVLNREEAGIACDYIREGANRPGFMAQFERACSPGFDPDRDLGRIGCANQTTMLSSESLEIGEMFREAMLQRHGANALGDRYKAFDTICSATQDRQDAIAALLSEQRLDLMLVLGGYNSSNTCNLARICAEKLPTYHIANPDRLLSSEHIRHKPVDAKHETVATGWLSAGPLSIGLTSGASTPDNLVEQVILRLDVLVNS